MMDQHLRAKTNSQINKAAPLKEDLLNISDPFTMTVFLDNNVTGGTLEESTGFSNTTQTQPIGLCNFISQVSHGKKFILYGWFEYILLVLCFTGIVGNCLNLSVLTRRRFRTALNNLESSANYGLVALAVSDLCYCVVVLPHVFLPRISGYVKVNKHIWILGYKLYGIAFINLFQMISTWIIVIIAINRWIVVRYPLRAKRLIDKRVTLCSILVMCLISLCLTMPSFLQRSIKRCQEDDAESGYMIYTPWSNSMGMAIQVYVTLIWPILASFVPLLMLVWCNIRLIMEIRHATKQDCSIGRRLHPQNKDVVSKVTLTLMCIVLMYFLLVTPGEIIRYMNPYVRWGKVGIVVAKALNLLQTVNFAFNFLLYCAVNAAFRQTFREMIRPRRKSPSFRPNDDNKSLHSLLSRRFLRTSSTRSSL